MPRSAALPRFTAGAFFVPAVKTRKRMAGGRRLSAPTCEERELYPVADLIRAAPFIFAWRIRLGSNHDRRGERAMCSSEHMPYFPFENLPRNRLPGATFPLHFEMHGKPWRLRDQYIIMHGGASS